MGLGCGEECVRVTVSHTRPKAEVMRAVDRSLDDLFRGLGTAPLQIVHEQRAWQGSTLAFSFSAKVGPVSTPIKGTVQVTDIDLTIDADLGFLERFLPAKQSRAAIEGKIRGLLT